MRNPTEEAARITKALRRAGLPVTNRKNSMRWEGEGVYVSRLGVSRTLVLGYRDAIVLARPRTDEERTRRNAAMDGARAVISRLGLAVDGKGFIELGGAA